MYPREDVILKVELQSLGVRLRDAGAAGLRIGGAGPTDGVTLLIGELVATVPTMADFVSESPFELVQGIAVGEPLLLRDGNPYREVSLIGTPAFYSRETESGIPFSKIALRHGRDAIGSTVAQTCMRTEDACGFCGIALSRESGSTVGQKHPDDLAAVARAALDEGYTHAVLTTGTTNPVDCGIAHLERCAAAVGEATGRAMGIHVQFEPPEDGEWIERIASVSDSAAINIESFDETTLARVAPGKAATGLAAYVRTWRQAVSLFGKGQVCSFIIVGLGEEPSSVLEGCEILCDLGVYPYVLPFRPVRGTPLGGLPAPPVEAMLELYENAAATIASAGLSGQGCAAGCVRCGACSAITDW